MRKVWLGGLCLLAALVWVALARVEAPGSERLVLLDSALSEEATPTPTAEDGEALAEESPTAEVEEASQAVSPVAEEAPAPPVEATPQAAAEGPTMPGPSRPATTAQVYVPQPLPLHPFLPAGDRPRLVALDPGHGGPEVGAAYMGTAEKSVNLKIALKLRDLLVQDGMKVVLTRDSDRRAYPPGSDQTSSDGLTTRQDLQARMDIANLAKADVFISIHNNGSVDPRQAGTEVWWDGKRPFAAFNEALAEDTLASLLEAIGTTGYDPPNRGTKEDSNFRIYQGRAFPLFVLGPPRTGSSTTRAVQMPAILGETLFLSYPVEGQLLGRDDVLAAIAEAYREGLRRYFQRIEQGELAMPAEGFQLEVPNNFVLTPPTPGS